MLRHRMELLLPLICVADVCVHAQMLNIKMQRGQSTQQQVRMTKMGLRFRRLQQVGSQHILVYTYLSHCY